MKFLDDLYVILLSLAIIFAAIPLRSWLESNLNIKKMKSCEAWLREKPSLTEYLEEHNQSEDKISCYYCGGNRILQIREKVTNANFQHFFFRNKYSGYLYWRSHCCGKCQTVLYRSVEEMSV